MKFDDTDAFNIARLMHINECKTIGDVYSALCGMGYKPLHVTRCLSCARNHKYVNFYSNRYMNTEITYEPKFLSLINDLEALQHMKEIIDKGEIK